MDTTQFGRAERQPPASSLSHIHDDPEYRETHTDDILVHFEGQFGESQGDPRAQKNQQWGSSTQSAARRAASKRSLRSYSARMSRQKSRNRNMFGGHAKPGITVDTSFARHKGREPHQVFPQEDLSSSGPLRKQSWFSSGRASTRNKGLGITKGTPQPEHTHRVKPSVDQSDMLTAISLTPGNKSWQEISPWDRRIPIGISVPTDSISDFSSLNGARLRSGSDATLMTPNIVITPAEAMKSVWSPDTPFTESDYTPSIYSRYGFNAHSTDHTAPPVPALPAGVTSSSGIQVIAPSDGSSQGHSNHNRNDTLDSNGTAFEEDDDVKRSHRIMSTGTVFEEDETPLRERIVEAPTAIDTSMEPTPRRSQGWWNVITTPFVTTPNTVVFPHNEHKSATTPAVPNLLATLGVNREASSGSSKSQVTGASVPTAQLMAQQGTSPAHTTTIKTATVAATQTPQITATSDGAVTSPLSAMSASPIVGTVAVGTALMPRQEEEQPRTININIELQDRRANTDAKTSCVKADLVTTRQQNNTSPPAHKVSSASSNLNSAPRILPVFAPPPTHATKGSHFSYDQHSRSSSPASTRELKGKRNKKHRKVCDMMSYMPFSKRKRQAKQDDKKKKKRGWCFWGCCCCLVFLILLAILIPLTVVLTRKRNDTPIESPGSPGTQPDQAANSGWLNLPNYPPIPTGISTISQPEAVEEESGCVAPTTLWSCAVPKELQDSMKPNKPDQPNFRVHITYENGTTATSSTKRVANAVSVGAFIRSRLLGKRAAPSPSPAAPNETDMSFLGRTTDGNSAPFEGEATPLYITFQDSRKAASGLLKRAGANDPTNITGVIPPPMLDSDGTAAAANLLPLPSAQPLRLYNRGADNEHYGFYTYFDRSIFLKQINGTNRGGNPADTDGGSPKSAASLRCTFSETRFLVQIWTRSKASKALLQSSPQTGPDSNKRPGTFPYPVTVTLDRHGGNAAKKNLYCYQMESDGSIQDKESKKSFQFEDRAFGGNLVNGTQGRPIVTGPIDGGTGGCRCQWQNWLN
ncbi:hypothetical protein BDU57DRAFT_361617 [Ampelomyces quisqualis]|uniref:Glycoprotease family protein n=1 Tax=Ampelomyces quisqualis TaxID=50730 RepID=A0A6A5Q9Q6_AMPQU|nr:hypothetical protein BDU57DRAFT_361617 [Ampelomyces quisqualis]